ncbi:hypothetical protein Acr_25g0002570 [Actinidia rufa]|uniref:Semialdehyde dehydrogenase NAD-binding domain-containing protein n=1 Tax=Actinidia rufa TaxID=165716 RepID=A0A7J0GYP0_9ERIC|nr:hypothetical protein Acr_25g0002570 [Actinidia rufa]
MPQPPSTSTSAAVATIVASSSSSSTHQPPLRRGLHVLPRGRPLPGRGGRDLLRQDTCFQALRPQQFTCVVNDVGYELMPPSFNVVVDYPLFNAGGSFSKQFGPIAMDRGSIVVDNSLTFRRDENVPLVSPELMVDTSLEIWASNQQSILLGFLGIGPQTIKGRPAQTNKNKRPGRGRSKPLRCGDQTNVMTADGVMGRVHGSRRDPRKDEYGKISRRYRRHNWGDCHLEGFWKVLVEILSNLPRPRARRRQYPGSWRADEHFGGGSGELGGYDLARFHGLVLPRSRGFGDDVWQSNVMGLHGIDVWRCPLSPLGRGT